MYDKDSDKTLISECFSEIIEEIEKWDYPKTKLR
jgi:hypothetical protein